MRAFTLLLTVALFACNEPVPERVPGAIAATGEVIFTVNGDLNITEEMYSAVTDRIPPEQLEQMKSAPGGENKFQEQIALGQVLYKKALEDGLDKLPGTKNGLAMAEREFLAGLYVQHASEKAATDEEIAKAYEEKKVQYARPQVSARHILVAEEDLANTIMAELTAGGDFAALAQKHSTDPGSKDKGGDLGWFEKRRMDPAFGEAAFAAATGETVGPISTRFGFHIIKVEDKRDTVPLDEVRDEIAAGLRQTVVQELIEGLQKDLKVTRPGDAPAADAAPADAPAAPAGAAPAGAAPAGAAPATAPPAAPAAHGADDGHGH